VFETRGYLEVVIDDIVAEAGVARGSFYTYFPAKLDVFKELARRTEAQIRDALRFHAEDQGLDPVEALDRSHRRYFDVYRRNAAIYGLIEQLSTIDQELHDIRLRARRSYVRRIAATIARWQEAALADPSLDPQITAAALVSMISNFCYWWFVGSDSYDDERTSTTITDLWVRSLGLQRRPRRAWLSPGTAPRSAAKMP
jgi:AcrR family transcriptional regulator